MRDRELRVLLVTWGSRGDVEPMAGLAVTLREMGVDAQVFAPPDDEFADMLERVGVPMVPLGPSVQSVVTRPVPATPEQAFERASAVASELVAARFETLTRVAADGCDALLATGLMPAGVRDVAEKLDVPYVLACLHLLGLPSQDRAPGHRPGTPSAAGETDIRVLRKQDAQRVNALYGEPLNLHRAAIGQPPIDNVRDYVLTDRPWLAADPILCPSEGMTDLDVVQTGSWILPDERPLPADLESFLAAGEPPVYVGFGSLATPAVGVAAGAAIEAGRACGRRIVLGSGWAGLSSTDWPDDCFVVGEVNQQALFRRVATVIHHGGAGTTSTAARAGVPQIIVPLIADQPYWAGRVTSLGIGVGVTGEGSVPTTDSLVAALATTLFPTTRARAIEVAATLRTDGTTIAAELLIETVRNHRSRPPEAGG